MPHGLNRVVADGPGLLWHAIRLKARGQWPLVACTVDGDGMRREAVEVIERPGIGVGGQGRVFRNDLANSCGGGRATEGPSGKARVEEFALEFANVKRL